MVRSLDSAGGGGVSDHGNLSGLGDDDHTIYLLADGSRALSGDLDLGSNNVVNISALEADDYHESVVSGNVSGTTGLDLSASNFFRHTLTGDTTFSFDNPSGTPPGNSFTLVVQQDGTGGHAITWPSSVEWDSGSAPSLDNSANVKHMLAFLTADGGTTWVGVVSATGLA